MANRYNANEIAFNIEQVSRYTSEHNLDDCVVRSRGGPATKVHLQALLEHGRSIDATDLEIDNCLELAIGSGDLVIILQEPSERESEDEFCDILESEVDNTLNAVHETLGYAFKNQRDIFNTVVLDSRPLRPRSQREDDASIHGKKTMLENDRKAYAVLNRTLNELKPKVILVCHCDWEGVDNGMERMLCSSKDQIGSRQRWTMPNGHETTVIKSFHPGQFLWKEDEEIAELLRFLFEATFVIAANELVGRRFVGNGVYTLKADIEASRRESFRNMFRRY